MIDFQKELNEEQLAVVTAGDGFCLVLAGAGSGKTRAITYRVAYLLSQGVAPENILLMTFTNKAAKEMISRVQILTGGEVRLPWSGTFHHIGYRILRKYAPVLGYKNNFTILDSQDSLDVFKLCIKGEGIKRTERRFPSPKVIQSIVSYARNAETTIEDVLDLQHPKWLEISETIVRIASDYDKRKREANAMDFDDLLVNTYLLFLKSAQLRKKYSEQFQYVMVDEYQDTNKIQASIVRLLGSYHKNILVVGDDAQSIYSFRAADIQNILDFEQHYPQAKVFKLQVNYRSTPDILKVANQVISNNTKQYQKELKSVFESFTRPEVHAFADQQEEAEFVAETILELRDEGVPLQKIAVLFRAAFHSQALEVELTKRDVPYDYRGGVRFFERAHIKDVLAFLRVFNNLEDSVAWSRLLNMQVGIGPAGAGRLIDEIKNNFISPMEIDKTNFEEEEFNLSEAVAQPTNILPVEKASFEKLRHLGAQIGARGQVGWSDFLQVWQSMEQELEKTPAQLIRAVLGSKYQEYLENEYGDYRERLQDLEQLAIFAERQPDLNRFLAEASLQESYATAHSKETEVDDEKMVLSTIHQAKGLEWEAVFILNVSAGQFPSERSLREPKGIEEERRLFYVAVTRAKRHLYFTYPLVGSFDSLLQGPSMFIEEVDRDLLDKHGLQGLTIFNDPSDEVDEIIYVSEDEPFSSVPKRTGFFSDISDL